MSAAFLQRSGVHPFLHAAVFHLFLLLVHRRPSLHRGGVPIQVSRQSVSALLLLTCEEAIRKTARETLCRVFLVLGVVPERSPLHLGALPYQELEI